MMNSGAFVPCCSASLGGWRAGILLIGCILSFKPANTPHRMADVRGQVERSDWKTEKCAKREVQSFFIFSAATLRQPAFPAGYEDDLTLRAHHVKQEARCLQHVGGLV